MASFNKKLKNLLELAVSNQIVGNDTADDLLNFANSEEYKDSGYFSLSMAMGGIGALIMGFGAILIISSNWHNISDIMKITAYIMALGSIHIGGLLATSKGYTRLSDNLHFLGALFFIVGIGLIAQILHLSSQSGESYLLWSLMIAPLAFILRNGKIALMSLISFVVWGNMNMQYYAHPNLYTVAMFNYSVCIAALLGGIILKRNNSNIADYITAPAMAGFTLITYLLGFGYHARNSDLLMQPNIYLIVLLVAAGCWTYLYFTSAKKHQRNFLLIVASAIVIIIFSAIMGLSGSTVGGSFTYYDFGNTKNISIMPFIISLLSWVTYFGLTIWGIIYGALQHKRWMLNTNITLLGIGIFTRFLDLFATMMSTGIAFIACGVALFIIGYFLEKWRRKLLTQNEIQ